MNNKVISETVRKVCIKRGITLTELARRTNQAPSSLSRKLSKETISIKAFRSYMRAMDVDYEIVVTYPDGIEIRQNELNTAAEMRLGLLKAQLEAERKKRESLEEVLRAVREELGNAEKHVKMALMTADDPRALSGYLNGISGSDSRSNGLLCGALNEKQPLPTEKAAAQEDRPVCSGELACG